MLNSRGAAAPSPRYSMNSSSTPFSAFRRPNPQAANTMAAPTSRKSWPWAAAIKLNPTTSSVPPRSLPRSPLSARSTGSCSHITTSTSLSSPAAAPAIRSSWPNSPPPFLPHRKRPSAATHYPPLTTSGQSRSSPLLSSAFPRTPRRPLPSLFSPTKPSTNAPAISPPPPARTNPPYSVKFPMLLRAELSQPGLAGQHSVFRSGSFAAKARFLLTSLLLGVLPLYLQGCLRAKSTPAALVFLIESNPANLDPRFATDGQSQHLDSLIFSSLVARDDQMNILPDLARAWDTPDALTYVFHLRPNVRFHDGRPLTSADIKSTFEFILNPANHSPKRGGFSMIASIATPDPATVVFHLNESYASFLFALSRPAIGIVPHDAPSDFSRHPVGSGPFRFISQSQDDEVVLERNPDYFLTQSEDRRAPGTPDNAQFAPAFTRVRFRVVPDAIVRALELRKGSADIEISSLNPDLIPVLARQPLLAVSERPGSNLNYLSFNCLDPALSNPVVRQALAYATDRAALIRFLLHGQATLAAGVIPPTNWAYEPNVPPYALDLSRAEHLLDSAGLPRRPSPSPDAKNFHRGASPAHRRRSARPVAARGNRLGGSPPRNRHPALRCHQGKLSDHAAALGRRQQRSGFFRFRLLNPAHSAGRGQPRPLSQFAN